MWGKNVKPFTNLWWTECFSARVKDSQYAPQVGLSDLYIFFDSQFGLHHNVNGESPFHHWVNSHNIDGVNVRVEIKSLDMKVIQGNQ